MRVNYVLLDWEIIYNLLSCGLLLRLYSFVCVCKIGACTFFHYSELKDMHSDELNIGDEVKFHVGASKNNNRRGGSSSGDGGGEEDPEKLSAYHVTVLEPGTV